jgi:hypothetical protein
MGGRLPKVVKTHLQELKDMLNNGIIEVKPKKPTQTAVYIRPNLHKEQPGTLSEVRQWL